MKPNIRLQIINDIAFLDCVNDKNEWYEVSIEKNNQEVFMLLEKLLAHLNK